MWSGQGWTRRQALGRVAGACAAVAGAGRLGTAAADEEQVFVGDTAADPFPLAWLAEQVQAGIERDAFGVVRLFGLLPDVAAEVFLAVTRTQGLPASYRPRDLVSAAAAGIPAAGDQLVRALIVDDTRALIWAAQAEGHQVLINSGYRSYATQEVLFAAQVARRGGDEESANRYSARPGHSQHQLGTTIDFQGSSLFRAFGASPAGQWLRAHAHEYGFVFPYTEAGQERTGYVSEPWHTRWVGRQLAGAMQALGYQERAALTADEVIGVVRTLAGLA